jgi:hypothetical protein
MVAVENTHKRYLLFGTGILATLTEMSLLGHTIEQIKIIRQASGDSYNKICSSMILDFKSNGIRAFYRGFYPYGVLQSAKGIPVLYVQDYVSYKLQTSSIFRNLSHERNDVIQTQASVIGGVCGGFSQAFVVTPLQRLKTEMMTFQHTQSSFQVITNILKTQGFQSLYRGFSATAAKRSLDWGTRFYGISEFRHMYPEFSQTNTGNFISGIVGGLFSLISTPFEVLVAISQRSQIKSMTIRQIMNEIGFRELTRGLTVKALDSCYHTSMIMMLSPIYKQLMEQFI